MSWYGTVPKVRTRGANERPSRSPPSRVGGSTPGGRGSGTTAAATDPSPTASASSSGAGHHPVSAATSLRWTAAAARSSNCASPASRSARLACSSSSRSGAYGGQHRRWVGAPEPLQPLRGLADRRIILGPNGVELHHPGVRHEHQRVAQCVRQRKQRYPLHPHRRDSSGHGIVDLHRSATAGGDLERGAASPRIRGEHRSRADRRAGTEAGTTQ